eukprot:jgi/Mesvir1/19152/Mv01175-RA.1
MSRGSKNRLIIVDSSDDEEKEEINISTAQTKSVPHTMPVTASKRLLKGTLPIDASQPKGAVSRPSSQSQSAKPVLQLSKSQAAPRPPKLEADPNLKTAPRDDSAASSQLQPTPSSAARDAQLWVDKYTPNEVELAVAKKKVQEIKAWMEKELQRLEGAASASHPADAGGSSHVLLLTGPPGSGKTAAVRALAASLGVDVLDWDIPVPTLWEEHVHMAGAGGSYSSKMDDFEAFVERAAKFPTLAMAARPPPPRTPTPTPTPTLTPTPMSMACGSTSSVHNKDSSHNSMNSNYKSASHNGNSHREAGGNNKGGNKNGWGGSSSSSVGKGGALSVGFGGPSPNDLVRVRPSDPAGSLATTSATAKGLDPAFTAPGSSQRSGCQHPGGEPLASSQNFARPHESIAPSQTTRPKLLLVDDLPLAHDGAHLRRLCADLAQLSRSARFPTVVLLTNAAPRAVAAQGGAGNGRGGWQVGQDVEQAVLTGNATKICLNPVTVAATTKALQHVLQGEGVSLPDDTLAALVQASGGDLRQAITSAQFYSQGLDPQPVRTGAAGGRGRGVKRKKGKGGQVAGSQSSGHDAGGVQAAAGSAGIAGSRDPVLSIHHALGKFLHAKRLEGGEEEPTVASSANAAVPLVLAPHLRRRPLKMEAGETAVVGSATSSPSPELVAASAGIEAETLTSFLHENALNYFDDNTIDACATALSYLSDADAILGQSSLGTRGGGRRSGAGAGFTSAEEGADPSTLGEQAVMSLAARGYLFANEKPAAPGWCPTRAPLASRVRMVGRQNQGDVDTFSRTAYPHIGLLCRHGGGSSLATEFLPQLRRATQWFRGHPGVHPPVYWCNTQLATSSNRRPFPDADASPLETHRADMWSPMFPLGPLPTAQPADAQFADGGVLHMQLDDETVAEEIED